LLLNVEFTHDFDCKIKLTPYYSNMKSQSNFQQPSETEVNINPSAVFINCKMSTIGDIEYANHQFCDISGYEEYELIGESMESLCHIDMPKIIFQVLFERLQKKEPIRILVKFTAKENRFFWLMTDFKTKVDEEGKIVAHYASSRPAPRYVIHEIETLYKILSKIEEKTEGTEDSRRYLVGFLEEKKSSYNQFITELISGNLESKQSFDEEGYPIQEIPSNKTNKKELHTNDFKVQDKTTNPNQRSLLKKLFGK